MRFLIVGAWNTLVSYLIFYILYINVPQANYQIILFSSLVLSILHNYMTQRIFVWNSTNEIRWEILKYFGLSVLFYAFNALLLAILVEHLKVKLLPSQLFITCLFVLINFYIQKKYVFLQRKRKFSSEPNEQ